MKVCPCRLSRNPDEKTMVIAYDVDGTLWLGSPAGHVTKEMIDSCRWCAVQGIVSGRADAEEIAKNLDLDFGLTGGTDALLKVKNELYPDMEAYIHVADTYTDEVEAKNANWDFIYAGVFEGCYSKEEVQRRKVFRGLANASISLAPLGLLLLYMWVVK